MPDAALHFSDVTFGFTKDKPLFENFSCSLSNNSDKGKIIALMGPSGVGKTTFCDLALGIRHPQQGSVRFEPANAHIAVIPQKGVIFDELSVKENIACLKYSKTLGKSFHEGKVQHAVASLGLSSVLQNDTPASAISGGEAQRVMLARIQTIDCDVLVLDEPCSFLDNRVKDSFLAALRTVVDESHLLAIMVTHVWDEAREVADEVLFFHKAQEKAVRLHCHTVAEAQVRPPTIDTLFAIHWPDCAILNHSEIVALPTEFRARIPQTAHFIGLFHSGSGQSSSDRWATGLCNYITNSRTDIASRLHYSHPRAAGDVFGNHAFYGEDGVILKTEKLEANRNPNLSSAEANRILKHE